MDTILQILFATALLVLGLLLMIGVCATSIAQSEVRKLKIELLEAGYKLPVKP